jgi:tRNA G46 methylase TrmB
MRIIDEQVTLPYYTKAVQFSGVFVLFAKPWSGKRRAR